MDKSFNELGFKVGDAVICTKTEIPEYVNGCTYILVDFYGDNVPSIDGYAGQSGDWETVCEDGSKYWSDLTNNEKGLLLLAHHNNEKIQYRSSTYDEWVNIDYPNWEPCEIYRAKPKPVIMSHKFFSSDNMNSWYNGEESCDNTHEMTYVTVDTVVDMSSVKFKEIEVMK